MAYLIDTDIIIFALRGDKTVLAKFEENKHIPISISMITYAELVFGAKRSQNEQKNMIKVIIPLSKPIIVVLVLYYGVAKWNDYFNVLLYPLIQKHLVKGVMVGAVKG